MKIQIIYLKELTSIDELFRKKAKLPGFIKKIIWRLKSIFCIVTVYENGVCILPYTNLEHFLKIKLYFIKKILAKINLPIVLSNYLESIGECKKVICELNINLLEGGSLSNYLIPEIIDYICRMTKEEKEKQEITLLIQNQTIDITKLIVDVAKQIKRIQIVTTKMGQFKKLENSLEDEFGIYCQITNNKRKSLSKSKIIINFDYTEEQLNEFTINSNAIVIDINMKTSIYAKAFCGIHVQDYEIKQEFNQTVDDIFEAKKVYEGRTIGKTYEQIRKLIKEENVKVVNLIGKKGIIHKEEYIRTSNKLTKNT